MRPPLDWAQAIRVATARLSERLKIHSDNISPEIAVMAEELATLLCAFGKLGEEFDRMEARKKNAAGVSDPTPPDSRRVGDAASGGQQRNRRRSSGRIKIKPVRGDPKDYARPLAG